VKTVDWLDRVLVVGGGTMGRGIAQVFLEPGYDVTLVEPNAQARRHATDSIENGLEKNKCVGQIERLNSVETIPENDVFELGIEAVPERLSLKQEILANMESHVTEMLGTNTSSIPLSDLDEGLDAPRQFLGLHFMNPAPVMPLVELVVHDRSDEDFVLTAEDLLKKLDKTPARVNDSPGFVSNRLLMALINRAIGLVEEGVAKPEAVDQIMELGMGHEMGPLEVADLIGLDVCLETMDIIDKRVNEDAYEPANLLKQKVDNDHLGRKTGQGFYEYD